MARLDRYPRRAPTRRVAGVAMAIAVVALALAACRKPQPPDPDRPPEPQAGAAAASSWQSPVTPLARFPIAPRTTGTQAPSPSNKAAEAT